MAGGKGTKAHPGRSDIHPYSFLLDSRFTGLACCVGVRSICQALSRRSPVLSFAQVRPFGVGLNHRAGGSDGGIQLPFLSHPVGRVFMQTRQM